MRKYRVVRVDAEYEFNKRTGKNELVEDVSYSLVHQTIFRSIASFSFICSLLGFLCLLIGGVFLSPGFQQKHIWLAILLLSIFFIGFMSALIAFTYVKDEHGFGSREIAIEWAMDNGHEVVE